jgi:hypothetical protein
MEPATAQFGEWLKGLGLDTTTVHCMSERLPTYFVFALHEEWARHPDLYTPIEVALKDPDTPFAWAIAKERAWKKNSAFLQRQVQEPMFGESFGLEKIYVPLRAWFAQMLFQIHYLPFAHLAQQGRPQRCDPSDLRRTGIGQE